MKTKHTQGEWTVSGEIRDVIGVSTYVATIYGTNPKRYELICEVQSCSHLKDAITNDEAEANAKLIAAAPDLLEALQMVVVADRNNPMQTSLFTKKQYEQISSAILKATT